MKIATINIPDAFLDSIETLVDLGLYPSRSEVVREAIKQFLTREASFNNDIEKEKFAKLKELQLGAMIK